MDEIARLQSKIIQDAGELMTDICTLARLNAEEPDMRPYSQDVMEAQALVHGIQRLAMADHARLTACDIYFRPFGAKKKEL